MLGHNHQVLAYGYDLDGSQLTIRICDPNWPGDDGVTLSLDISDARAAVVPVYSRPDPTTFCFFRAPYAGRDPSRPVLGDSMPPLPLVYVHGAGPQPPAPR